ncbi:MAG: 30S ribosomal protein S17 [Spirochaetia bacterium]|nr:30S ribosomal protein S17 [Spirochaetia bacterium]
MSSEKEKKTRRTITGKVVSDKMSKTRVILVEMVKVHPLLKKAMRRSQKYKIHDEKNESKTGDLVIAVETRPLSKDKRYRLQKIVEGAS